MSPGGSPSGVQLRRIDLDLELELGLGPTGPITRQLVWLRFGPERTAKEEK